MKRMKKSPLVYFALTPAFFFAISILTLSTNAAPSFNQKAEQQLPNASHEVDPGPLSNPNFKNTASWEPTCGTEKSCGISEYCEGSLDSNGTIVTTCPMKPTTVEQISRCGSLPPLGGIDLGDGTWCCKPGNLKEGCTQVYRTCTFHNCPSHYCVAFESARAAAWCPANITGTSHDEECNKLANGTICTTFLPLRTTKWLGDGKWCCKNPYKCDTTTRKCGTNAQCRAPFCHTDGNETTICPSVAFPGEMECKTLPRGKTKNLGNGTWCCNANTCDTDVKSCGGKSCTEKYCIGLRNPKGIIVNTTCPSEAPIEDCLNLSPRKEIALEWEKVCCNGDYCSGKYRRCGSDMVCGASFCVTRRVLGSIKLETVCPTTIEIMKNADSCESLLDGEEHIIDQETYCCKASDCPMAYSLSASGSDDKEGSSHIICYIVMAVLVVACTGISVLCYFMGTRKDKETKAQTKPQATEKGPTAPESPDSAPTQKSSASEDKPIAKVEAEERVNDGAVQTKTYMNFSEVMRQQRAIEDPTLETSQTGSAVTHTQSIIPAEMDP